MDSASQIFFSIGKLNMSGDHTNYTSCFNISQSPLISMTQESKQKIYFIISQET